MKKHTLSLTPQFLSLFGFIFLISSLHAHFIWIEEVKGNQAKLRFGEYQEQKREQSPGLLDKFTNVEAWLETKTEKSSVSVKKDADAFVLISKMKVSNISAQETQMPVSDGSKTNRPNSKPIFSARYIESPLTKVVPTLTLDIVPTGSDKNTFLVSFEGKPLAKQPVTVITPNLWGKSFVTDDQGLLKIETPFSGGLYVLETAHVVDSKGTFKDLSYEKIRYVTSLSFPQK